MAFGGSAVGPPAGAGGPSAIRQVKLDKECELRIEVGPDTLSAFGSLLAQPRSLALKLLPKSGSRSLPGSNSQFILGMEPQLKWMALLKLIIQQMKHQ